MNYLRDLENAITIAVDKLSEIESEFDYVETEYMAMKEKLDDISTIVEEDYSTEEKLAQIQIVLER